MKVKIKHISQTEAYIVDIFNDCVISERLNGFMGAFDWLRYHDFEECGSLIYEK